MVLSREREFLKMIRLHGGNGTKCTENLRAVMFHSNIEKVNLYYYPGNA